MTLIVTVTAIFEGSDLFEGVTFNPLGHFIEPKFVSEHDTLERVYKEVHNNNEPEWGKVNYGNLDDFKTTVTDINGVEGAAVGEAKAIMDMLENSTAESKVAPAPTGLTVNVLPGMQPDNSALNSFVFSLKGNNSLMAPRHYYLSEVPITSTYTDKGVINPALPTRGGQKGATTNVTVMQVPFGEDHFLTDTTGVTTDATDVSKAKAEITKSLNDLTKLAVDKSSHEKLSAHFFGGEGIASSYTSINTMINSGAYSDAYQQGLAIALGDGSGSGSKLPSVYIKTSNATNVYAQFDHIYDSMANKSGKGYFSPALVDWASQNAKSITHTLMVNYMMQSQFQGKSGSYSTPMSMNYWTSKDKSFPKFADKVNSLGKSSKEPFYLYTVINPEAAKLNSGGTLPTFNSNDVQPHLAYIFNLYTAIHSQVWVGNTGSNAGGNVSPPWTTATKQMAANVSLNPVKGKNLPHNANNTMYRMSEIENNNLVSGLSTSKNKEVYGNKELIGALRLIMSTGHGTSPNTLKLYNVESKITPIGKTKYEKHGVNKMYNAYASSGGNSFKAWVAFVQSGKSVPIQPLVLRSYWDKESGQGAYIMLPVLLGGKAFPESLEIMLGNLAKSKDDSTAGGEDYLNMSHANRYVMSFNLAHNKNTKTSNTTGVVRVDAGAPIGTAKDNSKPIVLTGYLGGETFNIVDYFLTQDALEAGQNRPPVTAKTVGGKVVPLDYFRIFEDFFTIRNQSDFTGSGTIEPEYIMGFQKDAYIQKYSEHSGKAYVKQFSPDYSKFFEALAPPPDVDVENGGEATDGN